MDKMEQNILFWDMIKPHSTVGSKTLRIENGIVGVSSGPMFSLGIVSSTRQDRVYNVVGVTNSSDQTGVTFYIEQGILKCRDTSIIYTVYGLNAPRTQDS